MGGRAVTLLASPRGGIRKVPAPKLTGGVYVRFEACRTLAQSSDIREATMSIPIPPAFAPQLPKNAAR
ncbi:hypothetical protein ZHAS_00021597 [Anopheles sinensis]|uniref:Uncharacterized protein n=1 Tax=Anopheles sinensis TaxID=74873 RepID=A0A084WSU8_ANOSI|nr:hypothetical protein ZHAS_00021597 [Anopheles sinensis]